MSTKIRLPDITGNTEAEQLWQIRSYLYRMVEQLNLALNSAEEQPSATTNHPAPTKVETEKETQNTFNSIKSLIIKSADIVNAYYEEINKKLSGVYVAESDFGTYTQQTNQAISENADGIKRLFSNMQTITDELKELVESVVTNAYINSGLLDTDDAGLPVYGIEVGQRTEVDGKEVFSKYARFTSDRLSFFDKNDNEVAYVSDKKLYIMSAEITGSFVMGGFTDSVLADKSVVTKWR